MRTTVGHALAASPCQQKELPLFTAKCRDGCRRAVGAAYADAVAASSRRRAHENRRLFRQDRQMRRRCGAATMASVTGGVGVDDCDVQNATRASAAASIWPMRTPDLIKYHLHFGFDGLLSIASFLGASPLLIRIAVHGCDADALRLLYAIPHARLQA